MRELLSGFSRSGAFLRAAPTTSFRSSLQRFSLARRFSTRQPDPTKPLETNSQRPYNILTIDGGGIRGIIPSMFLDKLERTAYIHARRKNLIPRRPSKRVYTAELFDEIAGTSTGALIALAASKPNPDDPTKPHYNAQEITDIYKTKSGTLFYPSWPHTLVSGIFLYANPFVLMIHYDIISANTSVYVLTTLMGVFIPSVVITYTARALAFFRFKHRLIDFFSTEFIDLIDNIVIRNFRTFFGLTDVIRRLLCIEYSRKHLDKQLHKLFDKATLSSSLTSVRIPVYNTTSNSLEYFSKEHAVADKDRNFTLQEIASAATAAPSYYDPVELGDLTYIDSGIIANNPTLASCLHILPTTPHTHANVVSLGTGRFSRQITMRAARGRGLYFWRNDILRIPITEGAELTHQNMLSWVSSITNKRVNYRRFQVELKHDIELDDTSPTTLRRLENYGEQLLADEADAIDELAETLVKDRHFNPLIS